VTLVYGDWIRGKTKSGQQLKLTRAGEFTGIKFGLPPTPPVIITPLQDGVPSIHTVTGCYKVFAGDGDDRIFASNREDILFGQGGDDVILGVIAAT
jgi:hypothetical protein